MLRRILGSPWLYYGAAGLLAVAAVLSQFRVSFPPRPVGTVADIRSLRDRSDLNLIFVMIDTLRADHMGSYGYERDTSPLMDDLAATGVRFAHVRAQSTWTKSSMASLWTGIYPFALGIVKYEDDARSVERTPSHAISRSPSAVSPFAKCTWTPASSWIQPVAWWSLYSAAPG